MEEDDTETDAELEEETDSSERWLNVGAALGFALFVLLLTWIFPRKRMDDWWTLTFWEYINAIGMFFLGLYMLKKKS